MVLLGWTLQSLISVGRFARWRGFGVMEDTLKDIVLIIRLLSLNTHCYVDSWMGRPKQRYLPSHQSVTSLTNIFSRFYQMKVGNIRALLTSWNQSELIADRYIGTAIPQSFVMSSVLVVLLLIFLFVFWGVCSMSILQVLRECFAQLPSSEREVHFHSVDWLAHFVWIFSSKRRSSSND